MPYVDGSPLVGEVQAQDIRWNTEKVCCLIKVHIAIMDRDPPGVNGSDCRQVSTRSLTMPITSANGRTACITSSVELGGVIFHSRDTHATISG